MIEKKSLSILVRGSFSRPYYAVHLNCVFIFKPTNLVLNYVEMFLIRHHQNKYLSFTSDSMDCCCYYWKTDCFDYRTGFSHFIVSSQIVYLPYLLMALTLSLFWWAMESPAGNSVTCYHSYYLSTDPLDDSSDTRVIRSVRFNSTLIRLLMIITRTFWWSFSRWSDCPSIGPSIVVMIF